ncbi:MAG: hypothetical protein QNK42_13615 [Pseudodonghicola sp.]|nr:hypothetical protein [Pseudodonghicola sp.]
MFFSGGVTKAKDAADELTEGIRFALQADRPADQICQGAGSRRCG